MRIFVYASLLHIRQNELTQRVMLFHKSPRNLLAAQSQAGVGVTHRHHKPPRESDIPAYHMDAFFGFNFSTNCTDHFLGSA
jgi:hypothetical protein